MASLARIDTLKTQHSQLESKIELESRRPNPDELMVAKLKREKLKVKDELTQLQAT